MKRTDITLKVMNLKALKHTDEELAKLLGISRPTLYTRLKKHNWRKSEIFYIESL